MYFSSQAKEGLHNTTGYFYKDRVSCRFRRQKIIKDNPEIYSLDKKYYVLLARGLSPGGKKSSYIYCICNPECF
jgi:DUF2075 family protein